MEIERKISEHKYEEILSQIVDEIRVSRTVVARQINSAAINTYWNIGKLFFEEQLEGGYGSGIVNRLSVDLKLQFPDMGLSPRNLWNMKRFYERYYQSDKKLQRSVAVLPWRTNLLLLDKVNKEMKSIHQEYENLALHDNR